MDEFDAIRNIFSPLNLGDKAALDFKDDIAFIECDRLLDGIVVSTDTITIGTHFRDNDCLYSIGQKIIRVNISDIIAKGCIPFGYFLNIVWDKSKSENELKDFARGIGEALDEIGIKIPLLGGDTTIGRALCVNITILGKPITKPILRHSANLGDFIFVSGNIGDAKIGLWAHENDCANEFFDAAKHYQMPQIPNPIMTEILSKYATSSLDVSDGLLGDAQKLAPPNLGVSIDLADLPFSNDAIKWLNEDKEGIGELANIIGLSTFGDDYQIVFSVNPNDTKPLLTKAMEIGQKLSFIGQICQEEASGLYIDGVKISQFDFNLSYSHKI
jgi:thiamine-monophosphate kinase